MFFTYLWRELRRRMRQAVFIAIGLALGVGLVITVTSASAGVKNAQASVLHSLYGVGTDITVTKAPTQGSGRGQRFGMNFKTGTTKMPAAGSKIDVENLRSTGLGTIPTSSVSSISKMKNVAAAAGGLTLTDTKITGTMPAINFNQGSSGGGSGSSGGSGRGGFGGGAGGGGPGGGSAGGSDGGSGGGQRFHSSFNSSPPFTVDGVDIANGELGPLSAGTLAKGATFTSSDSAKDVAVVTSSYATSNKLSVGSTIDVDKKNFKIIGIFKPSGDSSSDVFIPLGVAQSLAGMKNDVNQVYVTASSSQQVTTVASAIKKSVTGSTVTDQASLAGEVTGSISSAASLANNLGKWLAVAVLIAAFLLAILLTMSAVTRRIREFGTLKALGWKSRRVVGQVVGESVVIGIIGGAVGIGLGYVGSLLVGHFAPPLTASLGQTTGNATPGGARQFGGMGGGGGAGGGGFGGPGGGGGGGGFGGGGAGGGAGGGGFGGGHGGGGGFSFHNAASHAALTVPLHAPVTVTAIVAAVVLAILGGLIAGAFGGWRAARLRPAAALSKIG